MKITQNISFSKQLIIYLILVLSVVFFLISLSLVNSLKQFIHNNAYSQAKAISNNVLLAFTREINKLEGIPQYFTNIQEDFTPEEIPHLLSRILRNYPELCGSSIFYYDSTHYCAYRNLDGEIIFTPPLIYDRYPDPAQIIKADSPRGYWIYSEIEQRKTIALCYFIYNDQLQRKGILKVDFPLSNLNRLIKGYKLFKSGVLFVTDAEGNFLANPNPLHLTADNLFTQLTDSKTVPLRKSFSQGETNATTVSLNNQLHYLYYTPFLPMNWRIGIVCPHNEIFYSSGKLYFMIFLSMSVGLICLFIGVINIVRRLSSPLIELAYSTRRIAEGEFDIQIQTPKSCKEIRDLYDSFHYLQQNLIHYIEYLKMTTAEKEQLNSEMHLAQRIQQRFLPHPIQLPSHIELASKLRQCKEVGGDFYEYFLQDQRLYFTIGDVSGKGIPAALYMASFSKLFRYIASNHTSTAQICTLINRHMCDDSNDDSNDDMYVTIFVGILDIYTGIMTYTNAGHPYPLILQGNGHTDFLNKYSDIPIGIMNEHEFSEQTYVFAPQTTLLFYTDGITDAETPEGQFYGQGKMIRCLESLSTQTPSLLIQYLLEDIQKHLGSGNPSDDQTLLAIQYKVQ